MNTRKKIYYYKKQNTRKILLKRISQNKTYLVVIGLILLFGFFLMKTKPGIGYQIIVNDQHIGYTKNPRLVKETIASLDKDLKISKGENINYELNLKFKQGKLKGKKLINNDDLKVIVSSIISIQKPAYILKTDNGVAFAIDSKESMTNILEGIKKKAMEGKKEATAEIISDISLIDAKSVPVDKILNYNQAMNYIAIKSKEKPMFDIKVDYNDVIEKTIEKGISKEYDSSMYEGDVKIKTLGHDGLKLVNIRVSEVNGAVIDSKVLSEKILENPENKVLLIGTKPRVLPVVSLAGRYIGVPYVWGGTSPSGFDCSGLVQYCYARNGVYLPRTTWGQMRVGRTVSMNNLRAGDLCFFRGGAHVGLYIGNGQMIHAPRPGKRVEVASIYGRNFYMAKRVN